MVCGQNMVIRWTVVSLCAYRPIAENIFRAGKVKHRGPGKYYMGNILK